jgi:predicted amidohydrolase YtcJ
MSGGPIRTGAGEPIADWVALEGDSIVGVGRGDAPAGDRRFDLGGATLLPAFRDAHVHLPTTGLRATGVDLRRERSAAAIVAALVHRAEEQQGGVLFAANFVEPEDEALGAAELDAALGDAPVLLARADLHSCVVSSTALRALELEDVDGVDRDTEGRPTGCLRERAAARAWSWFDRTLTPVQQRDAVREAVQVAYSKGVAEVHEMFVVEWRGWDAAERFAESVSDLALEVALWLATVEVERVEELGGRRVGGDLFLDGSFGSHTAWMREPYVEAPPLGASPTGTPYRSDDELLDFFHRAQRAGMQTAVHAIGDAAIEQAIRTWERVAETAGPNAVRSMGHRIEHFECATDDHIERAARLGLRVSVQPVFDRFWGGEEGLYARRIGWDRAREMNRFASMQGGGLMLASGSDSTVTPLDPFLQMAALRDHHRADQSLPPHAALELCTRGPAAIAWGDACRGRLAPGMRADLALVDRDPLEVDVDELVKADVLGTWIAGERVWPPAEAETA